MAVLIVSVVSIFVAGMGVLGLVSPARMVSFVSLWQSKTGLWVAFIVRLAFGISLWLVAPTSRAPVFLQVLAVVSVVSALVLPLIGVSRFKSILSWWFSRSPGFMRVWLAVAVVFGVFILWSVVA
jgi:hypothetical protein